MVKRALVSAIVLACCILVLPQIASAQASITGVVKDTSGAVLPGVTVEAASPALIEKVRSVVTDGTGQYRIVDLRPGAYTVTFTLPGFSTVKREGIELAGSFTATVNAEMRVGAVEETITVSGEAPIVDVQSTTQQRVINHEVIDSIPTGRLPTNIAVLIPGVTAAGNVGFNGMGAHDVGGAGGDQVVQLSVHGSRSTDQRVTQNGIAMHMAAGNSPYGAYTPNLGATQEVTVDTAAVSAEAAEGGVRINLIPKEGGNTFTGSVFVSLATEGLAGSNLTEDLKARGLSTPNSVRKVMDINPGFGGPIKKDRLWFYGSVRYSVANNYVGGIFFDPLYNDPSVVTFNPDRSTRVSNDGLWKMGEARFTWQAAPKHKLAFAYAREKQCKCPSFISATMSPGINNKWGWPHYLARVDWTSPLTSRLLLEAGVFRQHTRWGWFPLDDTNPNVVGITEQLTNLNYKLRSPGYSDHWNNDLRYRAAASYITGAHAFKVGFANASADDDTSIYPGGQPWNIRVNNGVPNLITLNAWPYHSLWNLDAELGIFAQDQWTINRLTLGGGVRYDYYKSHFPEQHLGPAQLTPARDITFPEQDDLAWHDITPKMGASYDVFGTGKTALKVSLNKYMGGRTTAFANPVATLVNNTTRTWIDANGDFVPQCDLINPLANGECDRMANTNFGRPVPGTTYDPEIRSGWGSRPYNWEFSTGVQHEILRRVSMNVGYFRRWYGNFTVTDNRTLSPSDYDPFRITAPPDARLPDGGGYAIGGLANLNPTKFGVPTDNYVTFSDHYGSQIEHWNGFDVSVNARLGQGVLLQGGMSTGRTSTDNCEIVRTLPELLITATAATPEQYCHVDTPLLTQVKGYGVYTVPRVDIQVSATFQSIPGPPVAANYNAPNSVVVPSLGRILSGNAANVTVNIIEPGTMYGERLNQLDLRVAKIFQLRGTRAVLNLDVYNALNASTVLLENPSFGAWRRPQTILLARFAKVGVQFDF